MGYETYFDGQFNISPSLTEEQVKRVNAHCQMHHIGWIVSDTTITAVSGKNYDFIESLVKLIEDFFLPEGFLLEGEVSWDGEESDDRGILEISSPLLIVTEKVADVTFKVNATWTPVLQEEVPEWPDKDEDE